MIGNSLSLTELLSEVRIVLKESISESLWIRAEISELRYNTGGHCYLELIEKDDKSINVTARIKGTIWASTFRMLRAYFEQTTGTPLQNGMKILFQASVEFHEVYGMSLNIKNIDPTFTIGEMALKRAETIARLDQEGVRYMNKSLAMPIAPRSIAVISSPTAAGYEDFCNQLLNNAQQYPFYIKLFPAVMQGNQTEESVILALDNIYKSSDHFDCVVIIRGGGATIELAAFDNYLLAVHIAQFPLPVISGIGHQRDETIVDLVAHTSVKTPTAAAELLIDRMVETEEHIDYLAQCIHNFVKEKLEIDHRRLQNLLVRLPAQITARISNEWRKTDQLIARTQRGVQTALLIENKRVELLQNSIEHNNPFTLLKRGYAFLSHNDSPIVSVNQLKKADTITAYVGDGKITATIENIEKLKTKK